MQGTRRSTRSTAKRDEQNAPGATPSSSAAEPSTSAAYRTRRAVAGGKGYTGGTSPIRGSPIITGRSDMTNTGHHRNLPFTLTTNTLSLAPNPVAGPQTSETFRNIRPRRGNVYREYVPIGHRAGRSFSQSIFGDDDSDDVSIRTETIYEEEEFDTRNNPMDNRSQVNCRQIITPREFGGGFGITALLLLSPFAVCFLQWCCLTNDSAGQFETTEFDFMSLVADTFHGPAIVAYVTFVFAILTFSIFLPGRYVRIVRGPSYKFTALPIGIILLFLFTVAEFYACPIAEFIVQHYGRFGIYGVFISYAVAMWAYVRSYTVHDKDGTQMNEYGKTGNIIIDYALGRQINPKCIGLIEFKEVFYRVSLISTFLYTMSLIYETVQVSLLLNAKHKDALDILWYFIEQTKHDKMSLISSSMLLLYVIDEIIYEHHLTFSFEMQGEGMGCLLLLRYALTPYLLGSVPTYFFSNRAEVKSSFIIYVAVALFSVGLLLKRGSNKLKYKYRFNPNRAMFYNIQTIHTFQGRRLLLHSMWGMVRQPNYLGDILALLAMCLLVIVRFRWAPCVSIFLLIIILVHRCGRVNARNEARYHSSWVQYCRVVPYYLIPHVY